MQAKRRTMGKRRERPRPRYKPGYGRPERRGGRRAGSGRKKLSEAEDVVELARKFSPNAMRVLALVAATGKSETARVAAAAKIIEIDRSSRNTDAPVLAPLGKKEMALEAARLAAQAVDWGEDLQPPGYKN